MITRVRLAPSPLDACHARMSSNPVSSPAAPAGGCRVAAAMPVTEHSSVSSSNSSSNHPWIAETGAAGCAPARPASAAASSQSFGLYFIVHDPNG